MIAPGGAPRLRGAPLGRFRPRSGRVAEAQLLGREHSCCRGRCRACARPLVVSMAACRRRPPSPTPPAPGAPGARHTLGAGRQARLRHRAPARRQRLPHAARGVAEPRSTTRTSRTPRFRGLQFAVGDGRGRLERETVDDDPAHVEPVAPGVTARVEPLDGALGFRQVTETRRWRLTKTWITDPARATVLARVRFESLTGQAAEAVRARRPGAGRRRQRRPRRDPARPAAGLGRRRRERRRRRARVRPARAAATRARRATRGRTCRTASGCAATTPSPPATSSRAPRRGSTACASAS